MQNCCFDMGYSVTFKKTDGGCKIIFGGEWQAEETFVISAEGMQKFSKLLIRFGAKKKNFSIKLDNKAALTVWGVKGRHRNDPLLRFEYDGTHQKYGVPCHNRFNYVGFSHDEIKALGLQLEGFDENGFATIGDVVYSANT